ncbi:unnamed protein product [Cylindrotheca closterium]|uniref:Uncharacterized protein n=1 Tax=Cylindrotheca closterium TaxID=2856 RepID=A0AAD2GCM2_9STRA|nr:unnamed protein product [Cylindrotheca closterium]
MRSPNRTTAVATRQFFAWLEANHGGLPMLQRYTPSEPTSSVPVAPSLVVQRSKLQAQDLKDLFEHKIVALHVPSFYPRASAIRLGQALALEAQSDNSDSSSSSHDDDGTSGGRKNWKISTARGLESSDVFTLGAHMPWNMAVSQNAIDDYLKYVPVEFQNRRRRKEQQQGKGKLLLLADSIWPLDQLRLELDEVWPAGANLSKYQNQHAMGGGLPRIMMGPTRWKKGLIHVDELGPLNVNRGTFSANIYLQLPNHQEDGENEAPVLDIWPLDIRSKWDWYRNAHTLSELTSQSAEGQVKLRNALGPPQRIVVQPGDLVLLCVQRPHAAVGFTQPTTRVSLQTFLQFEGNGDGIQIET